MMKPELLIVKRLLFLHCLRDTINTIYIKNRLMKIIRVPVGGAIKNMNILTYVRSVYNQRRTSTENRQQK